MDQETANQILDQVRQTYNRIAVDFSATRNRNWPEVEELTKGIKPGDKVLDLGCGNGRLAEFFGEEVDYTGIDNSEALIDIAKKSRPRKRFIHFDGKEIPFGEDEFDKIFCLAVLHHIPGKKARQDFLAQARRVLRPEGKLILTVWSAKNYPRAKKFLRRQNLKKLFGLSQLDFNDVILPWGDEQIPRFIHFFGRGELEKEVQRAGFKVEQDGLLKRGDKKYNLYCVASKI